MRGGGSGRCGALLPCTWLLPVRNRGDDEVGDGGHHPGGGACAEEGLVLVPDHVGPVQVLHGPVAADVREQVLKRGVFSCEAS